MVENMAVCLSFTDAAELTILLIYEPHFVMEGRLTVNL
jgi:hypothetical protein